MFKLRFELMLKLRFEPMLKLSFEPMLKLSFEPMLKLSLGHPYVQSYLAYKKAHPPRTPPYEASCPKGVLRGRAFSHGRGTPVGT